MKIKEGYKKKPVEINLCPADWDRKTLLWIKFHTDPADHTLSYVSLEELLDLRKEINEVLREILNKEGLKCNI